MKIYFKISKINCQADFKSHFIFSEGFVVVLLVCAVIN